MSRAALLLALCCFALAEDQEITSGVKFTETGTLTLATGSWNLLVDLDTCPLADQVRTLRKTSQAMDKAVKRAVSFEEYVMRNTTPSSTRNITEDLIKVWGPEFTIFEHEIDSMEKEIETFSSLSQSRDKRSLIPIVGRGLGYLFGVATNQDVASLKEFVNLTATKQKDIIHRQEAQLTLFNTLHREQKKQNRVIRVLGERTAEIEEELQRVSNTLGQLPRIMLLLNKLTSLSRILHANLGSYRHEISRLGRIVTNLSKGSLAPGLLSNKEMKRVLGEIEANLPGGWKLAIPVKDTIWFYYESLAVYAVSTSRGWRVQVPIPIRLESVGIFKLYKGKTLPIMNPDTNTSVIIQLPSKYIAVSKDKLQHISLDSDDLQDCLHFDRTFVCPRLNAIQRHDDGCMWNAFLQDSVKIDTECKRRILTGKPTPKHLDGDRWIYAFWNETTITVNCPWSPESKEMALSGNGIIHVPNGCWVKGDTFTLLGSLHGSKKISVEWKAGNTSINELTVNKLTNISGWIGDLKSSSHAKFLQMNRNEIQDLLKADNEVDVALDDLKNTWNIQHAQEWKSTTTFEFVADISHWSMSSIALLLTTLFILYKACLKARRTQSPGVVTVTNTTRGDADQGDLVSLQQRVEAQDTEVLKLWREINRIKRYQL